MFICLFIVYSIEALLKLVGLDVNGIILVAFNSWYLLNFFDWLQFFDFILSNWKFYTRKHSASVILFSASHISLDKIPSCKNVLCFSVSINETMKSVLLVCKQVKRSTSLLVFHWNSRDGISCNACSPQSWILTERPCTRFLAYIFLYKLRSII